MAKTNDVAAAISGISFVELACGSVASVSCGIIKESFLTFLVILFATVIGFFFLAGIVEIVECVYLILLHQESIDEKLGDTRREDERWR